MNAFEPKLAAYIMSLVITLTITTLFKSITIIKIVKLIKVVKLIRYIGLGWILKPIECTE